MNSIIPDFFYSTYTRASLEWTRQIDIQISDLGIGNAEAIADTSFYLLISKHPNLGFVCNWFGYQNDAPNNPKYSDFVAKQDAWFELEEAAIANAKQDLTEFLRLFVKDRQKDI